MVLVSHMYFVMKAYTRTHLHAPATYADTKQYLYSQKCGHTKSGSIIMLMYIPPL